MSRTSQLEKRPQSDYRQIDRLSYSALKDFDTDRKKFWRKYILKEDLPREDSDFMTMGTLVDYLKTEPDSIDEHFVINTAPEPKPQMKTFCEILFNNKKQYKDLEFIALLHKSYEDLKANNGGKLSTGLEKYIINFNEDGVDYYQELIKSEGKIIITPEQLELAKAIVYKIDNCNAFKTIGVIIPKVQVLFDYNKHDLKAELDEVEDLSEGDWIIYDYKSSSFLETFFDNAYIKMKYYIQAYLYKIAFIQWCHQNNKECKSIQFKFKVVDMTNYGDPLLYEVPESHDSAAKNGFWYKGSWRKGVDQILEEIDYHTTNDKWGASMYALKNNSTIVLPNLRTENYE